MCTSAAAPVHDKARWKRIRVRYATPVTAECLEVVRGQTCPVNRLHQLRAVQQGPQCRFLAEGHAPSDPRAPAGPPCYGANEGHHHISAKPESTEGIPRRCSDGGLGAKGGLDGVYGVAEAVVPRDAIADFVGAVDYGAVVAAG